MLFRSTIQATTTVAPTNKTHADEGPGPPQSGEVAKVAERESYSQSCDGQAPDDADGEVDDDEGEEYEEGQDHHQPVFPVVVVRRSLRSMSAVVVREVIIEHGGKEMLIVWLIAR